MNKLEQALINEIGPAYLRHELPTSSERYKVSTFVWAEWNRMADQIKNIPFWKILLRRQARKKIKQFMTTLHVLHHYVPAKGESDD
jgi:hypothetical protein